MDGTNAFCNRFWIEFNFFVINKKSSTKFPSVHYGLMGWDYQSEAYHYGAVIIIVKRAC